MKTVKFVMAAAFAAICAHAADNKVEIDGWTFKVQPGAIVCRGVYDGHLQGTATDGEYIYWTFTKTIAKTDLKGNIVATIRQPSHQGDCCVKDGLLYVAVNLGKFNTETGGVSWVWAYNTKDMSLAGKWPVPELVHGAGGITFNGDRFYVVGGLPPTHTKNYVYEYTSDFKFVKRHDLETGYTVLGIQTASFERGKFVFGCYSSAKAPIRTIVCPPDLKSFKISNAVTSVGIIDLKGTMYRADTPQATALDETSTSKHRLWGGYLIPVVIE